MKIIDLLNKIANGEEVPKRIKYKDKYGDIVLSTCFKNENIRELEIYDSWRE